MALIYENRDFFIEAVDKPHVDRDEGGHIKIVPKQRVHDRQQLIPRLAIGLMRLTIVAGEAMRTVMIQHGVDIGRINYQDNGNWSVFKPEGAYLHIHLYGRAKSAKVNPYGKAIISCTREENPEHYARMKPLTAADITDIQKEIERLLALPQHADTAWGLDRI